MLDDAIVVVEVEKGVCFMESAVRTLRGKLGDDAMSGLETLLDDAGRQWKDDVLAITGERFERRLSEEIGALRLDIAKEFAAVRVDMAKEFAAVRVEMATLSASTHADILKWSFLFWIGQVAAVGGLIVFALRTVGAR